MQQSKRSLLKLFSGAAAFSIFAAFAQSKDPFPPSRQRPARPGEEAPAVQQALRGGGVVRRCHGVLRSWESLMRTSTTFVREVANVAQEPAKIGER